MSRLIRSTTLLGAALVAVSCEVPETTSPQTAELEARSARSQPAQTDPAVMAEIQMILTERAAELERVAVDRSEGLALAPAYWYGNPDDFAMGGFVFFNDRGNKQLGVEWVPGDPRRNGRTNIKYAVAPSAPVGLSLSDVDGAIDRAMDTWEDARCSAVSIDETSILDPDVDILHFGFAPLGPGTLAATFPFIWVDVATGIPTDIDGNGAFDYAIAFILYNSSFGWAIDANIDLETVALHEAGHGLGQGHFGKAFVTLANGALHFAPRAVLNAAYSGVQQALTGTDLAGHCSMWGPWPN